MNPLFTWAWKQDGLAPPQRIVLMLLAERADETGRVVLKPGEAVTSVRIDRATARRALDYLASRGLIAILKEGRGRHDRIYQLQAAP